MSAETLRRAASLMRERAEAATPGPWDVAQDHHRGYDVPEVSVWSTAAISYVTEDVLTSPTSDFLGNAAHIASWHPAVALAVADWLDGAAIFLAAREEEEWADLDGDPIAPEDTHAIGSALAVARAYLGESA